MPAFKRTLTITYGMVQAVCDLTSTTLPEDRDTKLTQVCTAGGHAPTRPVWDPFCPACQTTVGRATLAKASEPVKGQYVVLTQEEVADLKSEDDAYKGVLTLTAHDALEVEAASIPSGTTYHLTPNPKDQFYGLLRAMIEANPDLAFVGRYTVTSRASTYRVRPYKHLLVAEQMLPPEAMAATPEFEPAPVSEVMLDMAQEFARKFVTPFDPAAYADTYKQRLAEAVSARQATPGADLTTAVAGAQAVDPMAAMEAAMREMLTAAGNGPERSPNGEQKATTKAPRKRAPRKKVSAA